jgi:hypothetical protein
MTARRSSRAHPLTGWLAFAAVSALLMLAACGEDASAPPKSNGGGDAALLVGRWSGDLHQSGLKPFRVEADVRSLEPSARNTVSYTGIDCGGHWTYLGARGPDYRFREVIDRGRGGKCKGVGEVTLQRQGHDRLQYTFRGGGVESHGVLARGP